MSFADLDSFLDHGLKLPIRGKTYHVHSPTAKLGLSVIRMFTFGIQVAMGDQITEADAAELESTADAILDDEKEQELYERLLHGTCPDCDADWNVYRELIDDGVSWPRFQLVGQTVVAWIVNNCDNAVAEEYWNRGGQAGPKLPGPTPTPETVSARSVPQDYLESTTTPRKRPAAKRQQPGLRGGKS